MALTVLISILRCGGVEAVTGPFRHPRSSEAYGECWTRAERLRPLGRRGYDGGAPLHPERILGLEDIGDELGWVPEILEQTVVSQHHLLGRGKEALVVLRCLSLCRSVLDEPGSDQNAIVDPLLF